MNTKYICPKCGEEIVINNDNNSLCKCFNCQWIFTKEEIKDESTEIEFTSNYMKIVKPYYKTQLKHFDLQEEYMIGEELREYNIKILAKIILKHHINLIEPDDNNYQIYYTCKYCKKGQHPPTRLCRNKKYFKHKIDCPVLIAKNFLIGEKYE